MKKKVRDIGILAVIFIIAVIFFEYILNRSDENLMADIGNATLPRVFFSVEGYAVNEMNGYVDEMDVTMLRPSITPVINDQLFLDLKAEDQKVASIGYAVYAPDGSKKLYEDQISKVSEQMTLSFEKDTLQEEKLLVLTLHTEERDFYYYTRVVDAGAFNIIPCLDYVYNFHESALAKRENTGVGKAIEPNGDMSNTSFEHVTIHSDYNHVTWGNLAPQVVGGERWEIQETNENYTSVLLEYEVNCAGEENESELYTVKEFFRVRAAVGNLYLLNYDRTMDQVFDGSKAVLNEKGIMLGITPEDVEYVTNSEGTIVAFVQANELWSYNSETGELALLFSFRDTENTDARHKIMDHDIRILGMDKKGNTSFAVIGYMNRGSYEGRVGMAIYYYDIDTNSTLEKAFIPSKKSAELAEVEFGKFAYYSTKRDYLYMMVGGTLYEVDVDKNWDEPIVENLAEGQYANAESGKWIAYQTGESVENSNEVIVKNLYNGEDYAVQAKEGECIIPLGFVQDDFLCGYAKLGEKTETITGESVIPMTRLEIRSAENKVLKTYDGADTVIFGVDIADGMITLQRGRLSEEGYVSAEPDYIANNEEKEKSNIMVETVTTDLKETQQRIIFVDGIKNKIPKVLKPKQVLRNDPALPVFPEEEAKDQYYVYGLGTLQGIYKNAGQAIKKADSVSGVVTDSKQSYIWERGNKALKYAISDQDESVLSINKELKAGKGALDIVNKLSKDQGVELRDCTTEEVLYLISKGTPVVAVRENESALILIAYDEANVRFIDSANDSNQVVTLEQMDQMMQASGSVFIGYRTP